MFPNGSTSDCVAANYMVYEGGIRVPFLMNQPDTIRPGKRNEIVHFTDVLPTLVEFCSLKYEPRKPLDGRSFAPLLTGKGRYQSPARFWQRNRGTPNYTHNAALRDGPWKLVKPFVTPNNIKGDSDLPYALYHLDNDPQESTDLAGNYPERVGAMRARLETGSHDVELIRKRFCGSESGEGIGQKVAGVALWKGLTVAPREEVGKALALAGVGGSGRGARVRWSAGEGFALVVVEGIGVGGVARTLRGALPRGGSAAGLVVGRGGWRRLQSAVGALEH